MPAHPPSKIFDRSVRINAGGVQLEGDLDVPVGSSGVVIFAHGSGSGRLSPRNQFVAQTLREAKLGTLLFDLLTREEEIAEEQTRHLRFNIELLAARLAHIFKWLAGEISASMPLGFFGASTGGGAALVAAATLGESISAVVSRGGRPDLAGEALPRVTAPTLLIVGGWDASVIGMNQEAYAQLRCEKQMIIV